MKFRRAETCAAVVALLSFVPPSAAPRAQTAPTSEPFATVEGTVVTAGSGQPVAGARVQLFVALPNGPGAEPPGRRGGPPADLDELKPHSTTTGADGRFLFDRVKPGEYRLVTIKSGAWVPGEFGQRSPTSVGISFQLTAGQRMRGVQLVLTPTGSISGRVYDRDGPVGRLPVQALKPTYRDGQRTLTIVQSVQTDDRGEYRLFWLPPGSYYVATRPFMERADFPVSAMDAEMTSPVRIMEPTRIGSFEVASAPAVTSRTLSGGEVIDEVHLPVYYPGTTDLGTAARVDLSAGASADGLDIAMTGNIVRSRRFRGVVVANGQPAANAGVAMVPRTVSPSAQLPSGRTAADGSFDIAGVIPGAYLVYAVTNAGLTAGTTVQVGDADISGVVLGLAAGSRLNGRFVLDGGRRSSDADLTSMRAVLRRDPDLLGVPQEGASFSPPPSADGSFALEGVPAGDFRVSVRALPADSYIKSIRLGPIDVLEDGLHVPANSRDVLEIVVVTNGGAVAGGVVNNRQERVPNATVVLVPGAGADRRRPDLYRATTTDAAGNFRVGGVAAGAYAAFAWEIVEDGAWRDPDFLRAYESQGRAVTIRDGSDETVQLTAMASR